MSLGHDGAISTRVSSRSTWTCMKIESIMKIESVRFREVPGELMNRRRTPVLHVHGRSLTQDTGSIEERQLVPQAHNQINTKLKPSLEVMTTGPEGSQPPGRVPPPGRDLDPPRTRRAISAHAPSEHCREAFQWRHRRENTEMRRTMLARARCPWRFQRTNQRRSRPETLRSPEWRP